MAHTHLTTLKDNPHSTLLHTTHSTGLSKKRIHQVDDVVVSESVDLEMTIDFIMSEAGKQSWAMCQLEVGLARDR